MWQVYWIFTQNAGLWSCWNSVGILMILRELSPSSPPAGLSSSPGSFLPSYPHSWCWALFLEEDVVLSTSRWPEECKAHRACLQAILLLTVTLQVSAYSQHCVQGILKQQKTGILVKDVEHIWKSAWEQLEGKGAITSLM